MRVDALLPDQPAGGRIDSVHVRGEVAEQGHPSLRVDHYGGPDGRGRFEGPIDTAGPSIERIHHAFLAADEDVARENRRLRIDGRRTREAKRPSKLEPGNILPVEPLNSTGLKAAVGRAGAPTVPAGTIFDPRRGVRAEVAGLLRCCCGRFGQILGDGLTLSLGEQGALGFHLACLERPKDAFPRHLLQDGRRRRARAAPSAMADRARALENRGAVRRLDRISE